MATVAAPPVAEPGTPTVGDRRRFSRDTRVAPPGSPPEDEAPSQFPPVATPALQPRVPVAVTLRGPSREKLTMEAEVVAGSSALPKDVIPMFAREADQLWSELRHTEGGDPDIEQLRQAILSRVEVNPGGQLAGLWSKLAEKLDPPPPARLGY